jgi:lysophospholipase L1-like esterase
MREAKLFVRQALGLRIVFDNLRRESLKRIADPLLSITTFLICLIFAELFLRFFAPVPDPYEPNKINNANRFINKDRIPNEHVYTQPEEGMRGIWGVNSFSVNNFGFRGDYLVRPKPDNEFRIFIVDGSALECFFLDNSQSVNAILQKELNKGIANNLVVKVYNTSIAGARIDENISLLVHRIVHLEPDMVILLTGINDLTSSICNYDYLHYVVIKEKFPLSMLARMVATEFQVPRRLYYLIKKSSPKSEKEMLEEIPLQFNLAERAKFCASGLLTDKKPNVNLAAYRNNLKTIIGVARTDNIKLILMTQPSTWNSSIDPEAKKYHWMRRYYGLTYREDLMDQALEQFNDITRQLADEYSLPLYDLAKIIPKSLEYFYDDCHLNVKGSETIGIGLASFIRQNHLLNRSK